MSCNGSCIICSDSFVPTSNVSATKCGHTFHQKCLLDWLDVKLTCPKCREAVTRTGIVRKLYFDAADMSFEEDPGYLRNAVHSLQVELREKDKLLIVMAAETSTHQAQNVLYKDNQLTLQTKIKSLTEERIILKSQLEHISHENKLIPQIRLINGDLQTQLDNLQDMKLLMESSTDDAQNILKRYGPNSSLTLSVFCASLQAQMLKERSAKRQYQMELQRMTDALHEQKISNEKVVKELECKLRNAAAVRARLASNVSSSQLNSRLDVDGSCIVISDDDTENSELILQSPVLAGSSVLRISGRPTRVLQPRQQSDKLKSVLSNGTKKASALQSAVGTGAIPKKRVVGSAANTKVKPQFSSYGIMKKRSTTMPFPYAEDTTARLRSSPSEQGYNGLGGHSKPEAFARSASFRGPR